MSDKPYEIINICGVVPLYQVITHDKSLYITCTAKVFSIKEDAVKFAEKVHNNKWAFTNGRQGI